MQTNQQYCWVTLGSCVHVLSVCRYHRKLLNGPSRYIRWSKFLVLELAVFLYLGNLSSQKLFYCHSLFCISFIHRDACLSTNSDKFRYSNKEVTELSNVYEPIEFRFEVLRTTIRNRPKLSGILNLEIS